MQLYRLYLNLTEKIALAKQRKIGLKQCVSELTKHFKKRRFEKINTNFFECSFVVLKFSSEGLFNYQDSFNPFDIKQLVKALMWEKMQFGYKLLIYDKFHIKLGYK